MLFNSMHVSILSNSSTTKMAGIPAQLGLNPDETEVYNSIIPREIFEFNALPDNNAKITYIRAFVARDRTWRERSVCLAMCHILLEDFTKTILALSALWSFLNIPFTSVTSRRDIIICTFTEIYQNFPATISVLFTKAAVIVGEIFVSMAHI
ncbi:hypothetical protein F8M41_020697 [Gigaspora margarita]|uniref:Uncharacterized protein n=1 Tax=Gigaspora margarita TaxID=4874 RepID=A0A8H4AHX5_GIGMA|nr:hypothetical protein F8M41_020697 [Gigaspora margarita]